MESEEYKNLLSRILKIEQHLVNLIFPIQEISNIFKDKNLLLETLERVINLLNTPLRVEDKSLLQICNAVNVCANDTARISKDLKNIDILQFAEELKFMAKRIYEMEKKISEINEKGIKKNIHLDLTLDGYEMVRKSSKQPSQSALTDDEKIEKLLSTLGEREAAVLVHRYGLLGNKAKTLAACEKEIGIKRERIRQIQSKALRKLRHPIRKALANEITHKSLKEAIGCEADDELQE